ncbi:MAG TPA: hypothetical protein EYP49_00715 [Anaerolineae bacterium]|nr:hypothetical protein [Anaerolineae bacterium]
MNPKVLLIAVDGADPIFVQRGVQEGLMPCLARLMKEGCWGLLRSTMPPISCPAWISMRTGKNPGRLGFCDFYRLVPGTYRLEMVNYQIPDAAFWEVLSDQGFRVGVVSIHMTYPPTPVNGVMISPVYARSNVFSYPPQLQAEIEAQIGKREYAITDREQFISNMWEVHWQIEENRFQLAQAVWARGPFDLFACGFDIDRVHHYVAETETLLAFYEGVDRIVGRMLELTQPANVIIISDHGGGPVRGHLYINRWLQEQGFLRLLPGQERQQRLPVDRVARALRKTWLARILRPLVPVETRRRLIHARAPLFEDMASRIDWAHTLAFAPFENAIYINVRGRFPHGVVSPDEYGAVRRRITKALLSLRDPDSGEPYCMEVHTREDVFHGPYEDKLPDIIFFSPDLYVRSLFGPRALTRARPGGRVGGHRMDGVFIAQGRDFAPQGRVEGLSILDVAPTILHLFGAPIPEDVDGRVREDLFAPDSPASHRPPRYLPAREFHRHRVPHPEEDTWQVEERLRALGYIE